MAYGGAARPETCLLDQWTLIHRGLPTWTVSNGGEVHQWMYDRYSLAQLMISVGLKDPRRESAFTSRIPGWTDVPLDVFPDRTVRKPDSLFMEALRHK